MNYYPNIVGYYITQIPTGTAERIYAEDFNTYCRGMTKGEEIERPNVADYKLGTRVAQYIRQHICRDLA